MHVWLLICMHVLKNVTLWQPNHYDALHKYISGRRVVEFGLRSCHCILDTWNDKAQLNGLKRRKSRSSNLLEECNTGDDEVWY